MVKKLEVGKSYEVIYRIFILELNFMSARRWMFYGAPDDAIAEFNKINKKFGGRGGIVLEVDLETDKIRKFKKI